MHIVWLGKYNVKASFTAVIKNMNYLQQLCLHLILLLRLVNYIYRVLMEIIEIDKQIIETGK